VTSDERLLCFAILIILKKNQRARMAEDQLAATLRASCTAANRYRRKTQRRKSWLK